MTDTSPEAVERLALLHTGHADSHSDRYRGPVTMRLNDHEITAVTLRALVAERDALRLLLARNLVLDLGSGEDGADALGGIFAAIELVEAYREANPLPELELDDVDF